MLPFLVGLALFPFKASTPLPGGLIGQVFKLFRIREGPLQPITIKRVEVWKRIEGWGTNFFQLLGCVPDKDERAQLPVPSPVASSKSTRKLSYGISHRNANYFPEIIPQIQANLRRPGALPPPVNDGDNELVQID